jgi:hypothetical protein
MVSNEQARFAKAVLLGQKINMNATVLLQVLSRNMGSGVSTVGNLKVQIFNALKDLETSLEEFEKLTTIELLTAKETLVKALEHHEAGEVKELYESIQRLYRDDYLTTLTDLSK